MRHPSRKGVVAVKHKRKVLPNTTKVCPHPRCSVVIDRRYLLCLEHWNAVPPSLRREILQALDAWRKDPSNADKLFTLQRKQHEAIGLVS